MKLNLAVLVTLLVVLAAVCPGAAEANGVTVKIPADPVDCSALPSDIQAVGAVTTDGTTSYYVEINDTNDVTAQEFANCQTSMGMDIPIEDLNILIVDIPAGTNVTFSVSGTDFGSTYAGVPLPDTLSTDLGLNPSTTLDELLSCSDPSTCGMAYGDVGAAYVPEPTVAELLLFTFGLYLVGFGGWKGWKALAATWFSQRRLAAS